MLSCVSIICCSLLIVGTSYTGPPAPPSPPVVFFVFLLITKHTMILVITAVMSDVNRPVIGTAIATVYRLNNINIININWPLTLPSVDCAVHVEDGHV